MCGTFWAVVTTHKGIERTADLISVFCGWDALSPYLLLVGKLVFIYF